MRMKLKSRQSKNYDTDTRQDKVSVAHRQDMNQDVIKIKT